MTAEEVVSAWEQSGPLTDPGAQRYIAQARALALRVLRLEAENARLQKSLSAASATIAGLRRVLHDKPERTAGSGW